MCVYAHLGHTLLKSLLGICPLLDRPQLSCHLDKQFCHLHTALLFLDVLHEPSVLRFVSREAHLLVKALGTARDFDRFTHERELLLAVFACERLDMLHQLCTDSPALILSARKECRDLSTTREQRRSSNRGTLFVHNHRFGSATIGEAHVERKVVVKEPLDSILKSHFFYKIFDDFFS